MIEEAHPPHACAKVFRNRKVENSMAAYRRRVAGLALMSLMCALVFSPSHCFQQCEITISDRLSSLDRTALQTQERRPEILNGYCTYFVLSLRQLSEGARMEAILVFFISLTKINQNSGMAN
jgi:hypothetical protein